MKCEVNTGSFISFSSVLPYTEAIFKPWEVERVLKALAKKAADKEKETKYLESTQKARREAKRKNYLKQKKAAKEKAAKEKALRGY